MGRGLVSRGKGRPQPPEPRPPEGYLEAFANIYRNFAASIGTGGEGRAPTPQNRYCMLKRRRYKKDVIAIHST